MTDTGSSQHPETTRRDCGPGQGGPGERDPGQGGPGAADRVPPMTSAQYLAHWSALHGGTPATGLVGWWLRRTSRVAVPLVRMGVGPDAVTLAGLVIALAALGPAAAGGRWAGLTVALVVLSGLLDNLDGAVAVLAGRTTSWGAVLDAVCDRLADAAYVGALWALGAPGPLVVAGGGIAWLHEYLRARAVGAGMSQVAVVSVSERPTRVIVTAMFVLGCALYPGSAARWALAGAVAWSVLGVIGAVQVARAVRLRLR